MAEYSLVSITNRVKQWYSHLRLRKKISLFIDLFNRALQLLTAYSSSGLSHEVKVTTARR